MHQTIINALGILNDAWQNIAIVVLLADRVVSRHRTRRMRGAVAQ